MSKRSNIRRNFDCGKVRYRDKKEAVKVLHFKQNQGAFELDYQGWTNRRETRVYLCPICKGYHLTSREHWSDIEKVAA